LRDAEKGKIQNKTMWRENDKRKEQRRRKEKVKI
jgi:hypothetical protein